MTTNGLLEFLKENGISKLEISYNAGKNVILKLESEGKKSTYSAIKKIPQSVIDLLLESETIIDYDLICLLEEIIDKKVANMNDENDEP